MPDRNPVSELAAPQRAALGTDGETTGPALLAGIDALGWLTFAWAVGGVAWLLGRAVVRLGQVAWEALTLHHLGALELAFLVVWVFFMGYTEGYRELQRRFAPRIVRRAYHLARHPRWHLALLGPLYAMGLIHASRRRLLTSWTVVLGIVLLVVLVRFAPQPWRGLVDAGVVVGLTWGCVGIAINVARLLSGRIPNAKLDLPDAK